MENLKLVAVNKQAKTITVNLPIPVVHTRILMLENLEMSTDPDDHKCFFAAYHTDIKVPKSDVRSANNASAIAPYDPYPL